MPMGIEALDQFRDYTTQLSGSEDLFRGRNLCKKRLQPDEEPTPSTPEPATIDASLFAPASDSASLSNQDVDSLLLDGNARLALAPGTRSS